MCATEESGGMETKADGEEYAQVVKMLGNGRLEAKCQDGETRLGQIRGQMRKKVGRVWAGVRPAQSGRRSAWGVSPAGFGLGPKDGPGERPCSHGPPGRGMGRALGPVCFELRGT